MFETVALWVVAIVSSLGLAVNISWYMIVRKHKAILEKENRESNAKLSVIDGGKVLK